MPKVPRYPYPEQLARVDPEWYPVATGDELWRIYFRAGHHPSRWNQFRSFGPTDARFDHHLDEATDDHRSVMYLAKSPVTCLAEVFQKTRTIHRSDRKPVLVGFGLQSPLKLLDLTGAFSTRIGASMGLMIGARSVGRNWARGLHEAYPEVQGLAYPSSMYANTVAFVLNERAASTDAIPAVPDFHKALDDGGMVTTLKNAARVLGYALR